MVLFYEEPHIPTKNLLKIYDEIEKDGGYVDDKGYEKQKEAKERAKAKAEHRSYTTQEQDYELDVARHYKIRRILIILFPIIALIGASLGESTSSIISSIGVSIIPLYILILIGSALWAWEDEEEGEFLVNLGVMSPNNPTYLKVQHDRKAGLLIFFASIAIFAKKGKELVDEVKDPDKWKRI